MKINYCVIALFFTLCAFAYSDTVRVREGRAQIGSIVRVSPSGVVLERNGVAQSISANLIASVQFEQEPTQITVARTALQSGQYESAILALENLQPSEIPSDFMKQEAAFIRAIAQAKMALASGDKNKLREAGRSLNSFRSEHKESFHYFEVVESIAEILVAMDDLKNARNFYEELALTPWPETKTRAEIAFGFVDLSEGKTQEARVRFQSVLEQDEKQQIAVMGLGRCLIAEQKFDEAVAYLEASAAEANPEDASVQAAFYLAIGDAYISAGRPKDAILALLHVDILYPSARFEHKKAIKQLAALWREIGREDRAKEAEAFLY